MLHHGFVPMNSKALPVLAGPGILEHVGSLLWVQSIHDDLSRPPSAPPWLTRLWIVHLHTRAMKNCLRPYTYTACHACVP